MIDVASAREVQRKHEASYRLRLKADPERSAFRQGKQRQWRADNPEKKKRYQTNRAIMWREKKPWFLAFKSAKRRARKFGMEFSLTAEWAQQQFLAGSPLSGLPFRHEIGPYFPSIDRIDSDGGYTPGNSRMILFAENLFKNSWSDDVVKHISHAIASRITV